MAGLLDYLGIDPNAGGILGNIGAWAGNNSNALMGLGAGLASSATGYGGLGPGIAQGLQGFMGGRQADQKLQIQNASFQALMQQPGMTPQKAFLAITNPEFMKGAVPSVFPKYDFQNVDNTVGAFNPATGKWDVQGAVPKLEKLGAGDTLYSGTPPGIPRIGGAPLTPAAPPLGSPPPIVPNQVPTASVPASPAMANQYYTPVATGGPDKPPEGYAWTDPTNQSKGLSPITGGPATKLPANEAGYLALMQSAKQGVEQAKQYFLSPDFKDYTSSLPKAATAGYDLAGKALGQATGSFDIGRHQRAVGIAAESALRIMSGAAVPPAEVKRYADFFVPSLYDSVETRTQKINGLQRFMDFAERNMSTGRAPPPPQAFMPGGAASGPPKDQTRVQSPAWPPPPQGFTLVQ